MTDRRLGNGRLMRLVLTVVGAGAIGIGCATPPVDDGAASPHALGSTDYYPTYISSLSQITDNFGWYILTANVNMYGQSWVHHEFYGTLDGGGHTVSNLNLTDPGDGASFMNYIQNAVITNIRFANLRATSNFSAAGVAVTAINSDIENVVVEGTISCSGCGYAGGMVATMSGGALKHSYMKGNVNGPEVAGGLVGATGLGWTGYPELDRAEISESYVQGNVTAVAPPISGAAAKAGGIVGWQFSGRVENVYVVGNVTGSETVGGIVGLADCDDSNDWIVNKAIYRGNVVDRFSPEANGGSAGTIGKHSEYCSFRWTKCFWDTTLDTSTNYYIDDLAQKGGTTAQLRAPTTLNDGVYCMPDDVPGRCGDDGFTGDIWDPGTSSQHHILLNVPGPNVQLR